MREIYRQLLEILPASDRWKWVLLGIGMTVAAVLEMAGITLIPFFLMVLISPQSPSGSSLSPSSMAAEILSRAGLTETSQIMVAGSVVLILFFLLKNVYILTYNYTESRYIWNRYIYVGSELLTAYITAPFSFHREVHSTTLQKNIAEESRYFIENLLTPFLHMLRNVLVITLITVLLLATEPEVTIVAFIVIGGSGALILAFLKRQMTTKGVDAHHARLAILRRSGDLFSGIREFRVLRRTAQYRRWIHDQIRQFSRAQALFTTAQNANKPLIETLAVAGIVGITLTLWSQGRALVDIAPVLTLFGIATVRLLPEVRVLIGNINAVRYFQRTMTPIYDDLNTLGRLHGNPDIDPTSFSEVGTSKKNLQRVAQPGGVQVTAKNLTFIYPDGHQPVLQKLSLDLPKGSVTGLMGTSGSGKSTLVDLLLGLQTPSEGNITIDQVAVKEWLHDHPGGVGYIPQTIFLADDTLRRNVALGLPDHEIDNERLLKSLDDAQLLSFVNSLPDGFKTKTGEQGIRLSGGQRQRLGIARALYHQPSLIVMDEATSALDDATEYEVLEAIDRLRGRCTLLIISHRPSGLRICDGIQTLKNGTII